MRWNDESDQLIMAAAAACGVNKTQFIREAALIRAILVLRESPLAGAIDVAKLHALSDEVRRLADDE